MIHQSLSPEITGTALLALVGCRRARLSINIALLICKERDILPFCIGDVLTTPFPGLLFSRTTGQFPVPGMS